VWQVFAEASASIGAVLKGYNATIFAYGQTGTGKTHTMLGVDLAKLGRAGVIESDRMAFGDDGKGIIPRSVEAIFEHMASHRDQIQFQVKCSYLEIYNDKATPLSVVLQRLPASQPALPTALALRVPPRIL